MGCFKGYILPKDSGQHRQDKFRAAGNSFHLFSWKCANARSVLEGVSLSVGVSVGGNPKLPFYGNPSWIINAPRIHQSSGNFSLGMFIVRYQGVDPGCWNLTWSPKTLLPVTEFYSFFTCYTAPIFQWCRAVYDMVNEEQISYTTAVIRW